MRFAFFVLFLFSFSVAAETELVIFEQRDLGVAYDENFDDLYLTMDCVTDTMTVYVKEDGEPVTGAVVRLIYVDYSVPLLASGPTTAEGKFTYKLVGERDFMTGLFLVVVEKEGYKNKEAHFDIARCIGVEEEIPPPPPPEEEPPEEEEVPPPPPPPEEEEGVPPPEEEEELPPAEELSPEENITNVTENVTGEPEEEEAAPLCPSLAILLLLSALFVRNSKIYQR